MGDRKPLSPRVTLRLARPPNKSEGRDEAVLHKSEDTKIENGVGMRGGEEAILLASIGLKEEQGQLKGT
jgi:hypothetical protein